MADNRNRQAYWEGKGDIGIRMGDIPKPGKHDVLVQLKANGICGSDIHFYHDGRLGNNVINGPYIPGHEASGIIVEVGSDVEVRAEGLKPGVPVVIEPGVPCGICSHCRSGRYNLCPDVVFLSSPPVNGAMCDYLTIPYYSVFPIPKSFDIEKAALVEPAAVAVQAMNMAGMMYGLTAAIIGVGPIGLMVLQAFKAAGGVRAICFDKIGSRLKAASKLGADETVIVNENEDSKGNAENTKENMEANDREDGKYSNIADIVFECAGNSRATRMLFKTVKSGGKAVQIGWTEVPDVTLDIATFVEKELKYVAVRRYANAFPTALAWILEGRIKVDDMITQKFPFGRVKEAFDFTLNNPHKTIKTLIIN